MKTITARCAVTAVALAVLALAMLGCGDKNAAPEAVFKKVQDAAKAKDFGKFFDCLTDEFQNSFAGWMAIKLTLCGAKDPAKAKDTKAMMDKYKVEDPTKHS